MEQKRVVITGLGIIAPGSIGAEEFWDNAAEGKVFTGKLKAFDPEGIRCPVSAEIEENHAFNVLREEVKVLHPDRVLSRTQLLALMASELALRDSGLGSKDLAEDKVHIAVGSTMGIEDSLLKQDSQALSKTNLVALEKYTPVNIIQALKSHIKNDLATMRMFMNACAAGNYAIGNAFEEVKSGRAVIALAGGVDALSYLAVVGFNRLLSVTPDLCRPFDKNRRGIVVGEGSAFLILEDEVHALQRGAQIYATISGYGLGVDAYHITTPSPDGRGVIQAMKRALKDASLVPGDIDYVSAHGTGTPANDAAESKALSDVFGHHKPPMSSIKSMIGHTMGAASAIEAAACCLMIKNQEMLPTANFSTPDENCPVDCVPNKSRRATLKYVISNALAFGGNVSSIIFSALSESETVPSKSSSAPQQADTGTTCNGSTVETANGTGSDLDAASALETAAASTGHARILFTYTFRHDDPESYFAEFLPETDIRMVDRQSLLLMAAIWDAMKKNEIDPESLPPESTAVVCGSNQCALLPSIDFLNSALEKGALGISPMSFPNTVGNAPASRVAIWLKLRDKIICLSDGPLQSGLDALLTGLEEVNKGSDYAWACSLEDDGVVVSLIHRQ